MHLKRLKNEVTVAGSYLRFYPINMLLAVYRTHDDDPVQTDKSYHAALIVPLFAPNRVVRAAVLHMALVDWVQVELHELVS